MSKIDIFAVNIPFRRNFRHASKERDISESIFVKIQLAGGQAGFGESLPRTYVTGEDQESVISVLKKILPDVLLGKSFGSFSEAVEFCGLSRQMDGASKCAYEIALLDAAGKIFGRSIAEALGGIKIRRVRYGAAIGEDRPFNTMISALKMRLFGIGDVKVKVGGDDDCERLRAVRKILGRRTELRLDANCAWSADEAIEKLTVMRDYNFNLIEQPVGKDDTDSLKKVSDAIPEPVMADESMCSLEDAKRLVEHKACDMFNIRLSKCGGLLNALRIAEFAKENDISYQLGCQVGETGVLSAAGRHFASCVGDVKYLEGSYAKFLLREDVITEDVSFGYGGFASPLAGAGLGVTVDEKVLNKYVTDRVTIR